MNLGRFHDARCAEGGDRTRETTAPKTANRKDEGGGL